MFYRMREGCPLAQPAPRLRLLELGLQTLQCLVGVRQWLNVFRVLLAEPDFEWAFIDDSHVKAHQHSTSAASGQPEAIGKSRAGHTSKIHLTVDARSLPVAFDITGGDINDCTAAPRLIVQLPSTEVIVADKGYDSERIREHIETRGLDR
jgi:hypothetical protein